MFLKIFLQIFGGLFLLFFVTGIHIQDQILHPYHGSSFQDVNYAETASQPIIINQFKKPQFSSNNLNSEKRQTSELHNGKSEYHPDVYNLDEDIPKYSNLNDNFGNKYKTENLYTLAIPKMNFGRSKQYYVLRDRDNTVMNNNQQPHRFSSPHTNRVQKQSNIDDDISDVQHHQELKNIAETYPELFESTNVKRAVVHKKPIFSDLNVGPKMKIINKRNKNNYLLASDVSHVQFNGMGTSYEF